MSYIDLNTKEWEDRSTPPFNGNKAGIVDVTITNVEKNMERNRWEITFQDSNGATLRDFYTPLDENSPNFKNQFRGQGMSLRHMWDEIVGKNTTLPIFKNPVDMLDSIMNAVKVKSRGVPLRLAVDFGSGERHNTNLNRKRFVPFIERVTSDTTKLFLSKQSFTTPATPTDVTSLLDPVDSRETYSPQDDWLSKP